MICNPSKCKELVVRKKYNNTQYEQICNIPQCNSLSLLGVTLQSNCKFNEYVRQKLVKANMIACFKVPQKGAILSSGDRTFRQVLSSTECYILPFCVWSIRTRFEYHTTIFQVVVTRATLFPFPFPLKIFYINRTARF